MCGILGIVAGEPVDREMARKMRDQMRHRGPDGAGEVWLRGGTIALLHRRLAIIDLHHRAAQPMASDDGAKYIVFNGEIYNFQDLRYDLMRKGFSFRTESDTEVVLKAYEAFGLDCVGKLNGMFSFGVLDLVANRLILARDRAGEKPLFYRQSGRTFAFASELKALLRDPAFPRDLDGEALDCYLAYGYVPGRRCILEGYRKLPAAHFLNMDLETRAVSVKRYWSMPEPPTSEHQRLDDQALCEELRTLLADAVRRQLVADVPVGVLLSGGVDSSLLAALASQATSHLKTFTIRFPGDKLDESAHAGLVARHIGSDHTVLNAEERSVELLPELAEQYDEPMADSSAIPTYLVSKLTRQHCIVALGGDGGDELFGGYTSYNRLLRLNSCAGWISRSLRRSASRVGLAVTPRYMRGRGMLRQVAADLKVGLPDNAFIFDARERQVLLSLLAPGAPSGKAEAVWAEGIVSELSLLDRAFRKDFDVYLPDDVLVKVDRASMRNSLEVRAPLLDHRVVEFAFGRVPSEMKVNETGRKLFLKEVARPFLPDDFDFERKQGFRAPVQGWLKSFSGRAIVDGVLKSGDSPFAANLDKIVGPPGSHGWGVRVYALAMFELWRRRYGVRI